MGNFKNELKEYQSIPRKLIFDNEMTDRARFLYCYMASKPNDWNFFLEPMATELGYSIETLRKYINELVKNGWLIKGEQYNENGLFGAVEYTLKADNSSPCMENTDTEFFRHGKIPTQHNIDYIHKQDNNIKEKKENIIKDKKERRFQKPTVEEIQAYIDEKSFHFDAEAFFAYYESKGWKVGNSPMKNWKMACVTWERKLIERNPKIKPISTQCQKDDSVYIGGQLYK